MFANLSLNDKQYDLSALADDKVEQDIALYDDYDPEQHKFSVI